MITYTEGNIFDSESDCLINPVNCVGVMGKGLALQFKIRFPNNFHAYQILCNKRILRPGSVMLHETRLNQPRYIIIFPTKDHWRNKSELEYIQTGLGALVRLVKEKNIASLSLPPLGCGLGGLSWTEVEPLIERHLAPLVKTPITVYLPGNIPAHKIRNNQKH